MKNTWLAGLLLIITLLSHSPALQTALAQSGGTRDIPSSNQIEPATARKINVGEVLTVEGQQHEAPNIGAYIVRIVNFLSLTIGSFAFLALVIGGILMIASMGKEESITKGKEIIKASLMGLLIAFGAYWTTAFVQSIFYDT